MEAAREQLETDFGLVRSGTLPGFRLREYALPGRHTLPRHEHPIPVVVLMFRGGFRGAARREDYSLESGDAVIAPAARNHRGQVGADGSLAVLIVPSATRTEELRRLGLDRFRRFGGPEPRRLAHRIHRELRASDAARAIALEGAVLDLVGAFARAPAPRERGGPPRWLVQARELLESRLTESVLMSDVARAVGVSPSHLNRSFRRVYGQSAGSYVRSRRLERAAQMLRGEKKPLSQIAMETGFYDQSHFTSAFKMRYGMTPARYRKQ